MTVDRALPAPIVAALGVIGAAALVLLEVAFGHAEASVPLLVAAGLLVPVRVPWGGIVPVSGVPVVAAVTLLGHRGSAAALTVALLVSAALLLGRRPRREALLSTARLAGSVIGALVGGVLTDIVVGGDLPLLAAAIAASVGVVAGDLAVDRFAPGGHVRMEPRSALPVHLTLTCAGILVTVAVDRVGLAMAGVVAFPLLITRFSFDRYAGATDTLEQTVQALGLVPELAGLAPLGHSERSARYAIALARELGFDRAATTRVVTAARLHHLGAVPLDGGADLEGATPSEIAQHGARILRESRISPEVADLLAAANADVLDATAPSLEAAVVRVAATFDELVGDDPNATDRGLALVSGSARDRHSRRAAGALLELVATDPDLVPDAVAAGDRFREAAVGLDLEAVTAGRRGPGELLPFTRRV